MSKMLGRFFYYDWKKRAVSEFLRGNNLLALIVVGQR